MIFNAPVNVRAGNDKRKRLLQQMQARGSSMRGTPGVSRGAGAGLLARLAQARRPVRPSLTNPHAYDMSNDLANRLGITNSGGHGIGPNDGSADSGMPVPIPPAGRDIPQPEDPSVIPWDPTHTPIPMPQQPMGAGPHNVGAPVHQGGVAASPVGMQQPTEASPNLAPLAPGGGQSGLIPMGNGAYWDPQSNQIVYPGGGQGQLSGYHM